MSRKKTAYVNRGFFAATDRGACLPPWSAYIRAASCSRCHAQPGSPCRRPDGSPFTGGLPIDEARDFHAPRVDKARRHQTRDYLKAPWPEERVPGERYDTLGDLWTPNPAA